MRSFAPLLPRRPRRQQLLHQRVLQRRQAAFRKRLGLAFDTCGQGLARRQRKHPRRRDAQRLGGVAALLLDLRFDLFGRGQRIDQRVDLVQHDKTFQARRPEVFAPDRQIRTRHAGVGGQHEDHRVRRRQHAQRQFRFRADGVQAGRVDHHQPALQQRVRVVDHRVAPGRHFDAAVGALRRVVLRLRFVPETERHRLLDAHTLRACDGAERIHQRLRLGRVQRHDLPVFVARTQLGQREATQPGFDGQQRQARRHVRFMAQLHRTHRRAARRGRQHAAAGIGKEDRVDQLGLAARELGDECQRELLGRQAFAQRAQQCGVAVVEQVVVLQGTPESADLLVQCLPPRGQGVEAVGDGAVDGHVGSGTRRILAQPPAASRPLKPAVCHGRQRRYRR